MDNLIAPTAAPSGSLRFIDSGGLVWQVAELRYKGEAAGTGSLYFFSRGATIRVQQYPTNWAQLSWAELEELRSLGTILSTDVTRSAPRSRRREHSLSA